MSTMKSKTEQLVLLGYCSISYCFVRFTDSKDAKIIYTPLIEVNANLISEEMHKIMKTELL